MGCITWPNDERHAESRSSCIWRFNSVNKADNFRAVGNTEVDSSNLGPNFSSDGLPVSRSRSVATARCVAFPLTIERSFYIVRSFYEQKRHGSLSGGQSGENAARDSGPGGGPGFRRRAGGVDDRAAGGGAEDEQNRDLRALRVEGRIAARDSEPGERSVSGAGGQASAGKATWAEATASDADQLARVRGARRFPRWLFLCGGFAGVR